MIFNKRLLNETLFTIEDDVYNYDPGDSIEIGGYIWSRIGILQEHDVFLCNEIVSEMRFCHANRLSNDYYYSLIREWLNNDFYDKLSEQEKDLIIKNKKLNDDIFLLSIEEYNKFKHKINIIDDYWWLRSPGTDIETAFCVKNKGVLGQNDIYYGKEGVRPAILI